MSLVSTMVGLAIAGILALVLAQMIVNAKKTSRAIQNDVDLNMTKMTIMNRIDCIKTLGITSTTTLPLNCTEFSSVTLKSHTNTVIAPSGKLGPWNIAAKCTANELIVKASRSGNDPLTGKLYSSLPAATDIFRGTSDFCRQYFEPSYPVRYVKVKTTGIAYNPGPGASNKCDITGASHPFATGFAACPSGYTIIGGEGVCHNGAVSENHADGNRWKLSCCIFPNFLDIARTTSWIEAICVRNGDFL
jgi:type II secretory pathway pseudopilin PulG